MKYKVLKECVIDSRYRMPGDFWHTDYSAKDGFVSELLQHGFIEEIPEKPMTVWDLRHGDKCWREDSGVIISLAWNDNASWMKSLRESGGVFLTREDAERGISRRKAKVILERDTKGFKPDWEVGDWGYIVYWDPRDNKLDYGYNDYLDATMRFANSKDAIESIRKHEKEWKNYLGVEE